MDWKEDACDWNSHGHKHGHGHGHGHGHAHGSGFFAQSGQMDQMNNDLTQQSDSMTFMEDCKNWDIVKATQYGIIDRCKELVEAGYDVRQPDKENVTLLHWASINNRKELVKYYISKGAIIDQLGGDLNSTPLHWAIRQGHLPMVIMLMKFGADPTLLDGEGYSGLHLAVQFQHMPILAYLLSKGQNIDTPNLYGQTPLMLAAHKVIGPEPTNFLLKFNASVTAVDKLHRNTALHWAVLSKNENAAHFLLEAGANPDAENAKGETPIDLAHQFRNPLMLHMLTHVKKERSHIQNPFVKRLQKYKFSFMTGLCVLMLWTAGYIADMNTESWLLKGTLFACLFAIVNLATRWLINVHIQNLVVPAFLLASILLMFLTWFIWFLPDLSEAIFQITFCLSIVGLLYYFYKTWASDPGYIKSSLEEKKKTVITLAEAGFLDFGLLCGSCLVRRPARSLHCFLCDCCVAKHDHHSIWTNNCIGAGNHRYFVGFLFFLSLVLGWMFYGTAVYWSSHCTFNYSNEGIWGVLIQVVTCSPWVLYIFIIVCVHATWSSLMLLSQIYQITFLGLTTYERVNLLKRMKNSKHPISLRKTPYNLGCAANIVNFFQLRCFGLFKPAVIDWSQQYTLSPHVGSAAPGTFLSV